MWPFKPKKKEHKLKVGDLVLGYKFREDDVWYAYGKECLGYVASVRYDTDDVGYVYDVCWLEAGIQREISEDRLIVAREEYIKQYG